MEVSPDKRPERCSPISVDRTLRPVISLYPYGRSGTPRQTRASASDAQTRYAMVFGQDRHPKRQYQGQSLSCVLFHWLSSHTSLRYGPNPNTTLYYVVPAKLIQEKSEQVSHLFSDFKTGVYIKFLADLCLKILFLPMLICPRAITSNLPSQSIGLPNAI